MKATALFLSLLLAPPAALSAREPGVPAPDRDAPAITAAGNKVLLRKAEQLAARMNADPKVKDLFDDSFFKYVSLAKITEILRGIYLNNGSVTSVKLERSDSPHSAHFLFETGKNYSLPVTLSVGAESGRLTGLFFKTPYQKNLTLGDLKRKLSALPGRAGFLALKLGPEGRVLEALDEDAEFGVGSAFKLYVLGTVLEKGVSWKKIHVLEEKDRSLPTGRLRDWPAGSPLTIHTLAAGMISESDNTASDALIGALGRGTIEGSLAKLGHSRPERMKPFLKTSEMFRLKSDTGASLEYLNAPLIRKYGLLDELARKPLSAAGFRTSPFGVDKIEWPASPADLCRLMDYFRKKGDKTALELLAINPGLDIPRKKFLYAGYKGGSEPGVLNMTWLLKTADAGWYCLTGSWNNEAAVLDENRFFELMQAAINAVGAGEAPRLEDLE